MLAALGALSGAVAGGDAPGDVTFTRVTIEPDPLPVGEPLEVEAQVESTGTIEKVEMFYCNDDQCMLPLLMTGEGDGRYTFTIYAEGEEPSAGDPVYTHDGTGEVWVKIGVTTDSGTTYYPPEGHERYDEGYIKVPLDYGGDGEDGEDGEDGTDGQDEPGDGGSEGDGNGDEGGDDEGSTPGFGALLTLGALAAATAGLFLLRRRHG